MIKQKTFGCRISKDELDIWHLYSISVGYDSLSAFIRDSINGLIKAKKKPSREVIIVGE